jgi:ubiquitin carboxyl-terminal hydrolase L3
MDLDAMLDSTELDETTAPALTEDDDDDQAIEDELNSKFKEKGQTAKKKRKRWLPLESNPDVMNKYMHKLGLPNTVCFHDILSFEEWALAMVPRPVLGVLLLFPVSKANSEYKKEQELELEKRRVELEPLEQGLFFTKQYVANACGTIGLVHAVVNAMQKKDIEVEDGVWLDRFLRAIEAGTCAADDIGSMLEDDEELEVAHGEGASGGQSSQPSRVNLHFVTFVHHNGYLFELDGTKKWPVCHGECTPATLLETAVHTVQVKFVALDPTNPRFNLIALAPSAAVAPPAPAVDFGILFEQTATGAEVGEGGQAPTTTATADPLLVAQLVSMGFGQEASEKAVLGSGNTNADAAMDYGFENGILGMG